MYFDKKKLYILISALKTLIKRTQLFCIQSPISSQDELQFTKHLMSINKSTSFRDVYIKIKIKYTKVTDSANE